MYKVTDKKSRKSRGRGKIASTNSIHINSTYTLKKAVIFSSIIEYYIIVL